MKNEVLYLLLDNYADHEVAFLSSAIACDGSGMRRQPRYVNRVVAPTLRPVRTCGGMATLPDYSFATMPHECAALVLIGGYGWQSEEAEQVVSIVRTMREQGVVVGAICNAVSFLAAHGFLNNVRHTGNGLEQLKQWGRENYTHEEGYVAAQACSDDGLVTANGTGYLEFARELMLLLEVDTVENIEWFYRFNRLGYIDFMQEHMK